MIRIFLAVSIFFLGLLSVVGLLSAFNYSVDSWGVFTKDYGTFVTRENPKLNRLYLKNRYLLSTEKNYDCLIFGTSRVEAIDASLLGNNCYNFYHSGATPENNLRALKLLLAKGMPIKSIYLGVDDLSFTWDDDSENLALKTDIPVTITEWLKFYGLFALSLPDTEALNVYSGAIPKSWQPQWVIDMSLVGVVNDRDKAWQQFNSLEYQQAAKKGWGPTIWFQKDNVDKALSAIEEIQSICHAEGIELTVFFNPLHYKTWQANDAALLVEFRRRLALLTDYIDFSGVNNYTTHNGYWYETSHFNTLVGDKMADIILKGGENRGGFGRVVTSENIQALHEKDTVDLATIVPELTRENKKFFLAQPVSDYIRQTARVESLLARIDSADYILGKQTFMKRLGKGDVEFFSRDVDPKIFFNSLSLQQGSLSILSAQLYTPNTDRLVLYWGDRKGSYSQRRRKSVLLKAGINNVNIPLILEEDSVGVRVDLGGMNSKMVFSRMDIMTQAIQ